MSSSEKEAERIKQRLAQEEAEAIQMEEEEENNKTENANHDKVVCDRLNYMICKKQNKKTTTSGLIVSKRCTFKICLKIYQSGALCLLVGVRSPVCTCLCVPIGAELRRAQRAVENCKRLKKTGFLWGGAVSLVGAPSNIMVGGNTDN